MNKPKLTYFDTAGSRGEECRLALHIAGVDFEDNRIKRGDWAALKPKTPYGGMPFLEIPGKPVLAQVNAILVYIGRTNNLHPKDDFDAALHEAMMSHVEDLRHKLAATLSITDEAEKKKTREVLASSHLPDWAARTEKQIGEGPFFGGEKLQVVDLKLFMITRWLASGIIDHIPKTIFADYPKLNRLHDAVRDHAGVKSWYSKS